MSVLERLTPSEMRAEVSRMGISKKNKKARQSLKKRLMPLEGDIQRGVVKWLALQESAGRLLWFAVPNGGSRNLLEAVNLKRQGLRAGVPDLCVIPRTGPVCFIELKSHDGVVSKLQTTWLLKLPEYGCPVAVCRSLEEVQQFLFETGVIREVS